MNLFIIRLLFVTLLSCGQKASVQQANHYNNAMVKDTCDDPDAPISCSFINRSASLSNTMTMAPKNEPGEALIITGTVYKADGIAPYPNIIIYAYQTDRKGYYPKNGTETGAQKSHGYLHGWCRTDSKGNYAIHTIRPARYPDNSMPAHIHSAIQKENGQMYWITDFVFKDDALVNEKYLSVIANKVGGTGVIDLSKNADGQWVGTRNIVLTQ